MKKILISTSLLLCMVGMFNVSTVVGADFPFDANEANQELGKVYDKLYADGELDIKFVPTDEPFLEMDDTPEVLYGLQRDGNTMVTIVYTSNPDTDKLESLMLSGGYDYELPVFSQVIAGGIIFADPSFSIDEASKVANEVLDTNVGDFSAGNLKISVEDGFKVEITLVEERGTSASSLKQDKELKDDTSLGKQQAYKKAQEYISIMAFSRQGLIDQLMYDQFTEDEAIFGVDKLDVSWMGQAVRKAEEYLELKAFSKNGLIEQLKYEGFDELDAELAAIAVGYN